MGRLALHTFNYSWSVHRQCADAALDLRAGRHRRCGRVVRPILRHGRVQDKPFGRGIDLGMGGSWCIPALADFFAVDPFTKEALDIRVPKLWAYARVAAARGSWRTHWLRRRGQVVGGFFPAFI